MSTKITQARIQELESLQRRKADLQERIQAKKDEMTKIRDGMESEGTADMMSSSSAAALRRRGKETSKLTNADVLESLDMAIDRLQEEMLEVEGELKKFKDLVGSA
ncbi:hypothetical protein DL98DRAFT_522961 [Cadophora sp. DSE1049]|nr:hypothetical protein DL98DRAFT_522961 [Cadophora sp. DSE1049]